MAQCVRFGRAGAGLILAEKWRYAGDDMKKLKLMRVKGGRRMANGNVNGREISSPLHSLSGVRSIGRYRLGRLIAGAAMVVAVSVGGVSSYPSPALSADAELELRAMNNRMEKIERDLLDVQRQTYQAGKTTVAATSAYGADPSSTASLSLRLQSVEEQLRQITGRMEELTFQVNQSRERFNKFSQDVDYRFQQGAGGAGSSVAASASGAAIKLNQPSATSTVSPAALATVGTLGTMPVKATPVTTTSVALNGDPKMAYKQAFNTLQRGEYDVAEVSFTQFLKSYPSDGLAGNAQYWLGESYYVRGAYKQAAQSFLKGYTTYSASPKAPDSLLKLGMTLVRLGQTDAACGTLGELNRRFPSAPPAINQRAQLERQRAGC